MRMGNLPFLLGFQNILNISTAAYNIGLMRK